MVLIRATNNIRVQVMLTYLVRQGQGAGRALCSLLTDFATSTHPVARYHMEERGGGLVG